ncbi:MAG: GbsR/MarR family transcriptional regulator [Calditrichaceae bacterium]
MNNIPAIKQEFIQDYGEAYQTFGLPKLMGRIVGLLIFIGRPISLDDITDELNVSKGPVSQITRRLRDHNLIQRIWVPGDRKDYYQAAPDIFGNAFRNQISLMKENLRLAQKYHSMAQNDSTEEVQFFKQNMEEMTRFYSLMVKHFNEFLKEWTAQK